MPVLKKAVGLLLGDGDFRRNGLFRFCAREPQLHEELRQCVKELCNYEMAPPRTEGAKHVSYVPAILREILVMLGIPKGKKT